MSTDWTPPGFLRVFSIEWKARQYNDPIKKLAYLQRAAGRGASRAGRRMLLHWNMKAVLVVPVFLLLGARVQTDTEVNAGLPNEKQAIKTSGAGIVPIHSTDPGPLEPAWLVEHGRDYDVYSNGLRIENEFVKPNEPRAYVIFQNGKPSQRRTNPAGIIFHTTESAQAPFKADDNETLNRIGRDLLAYVSRKQAYHFIIDRFGRVFRIVPETDVANHAGYSVWEDSEGVYINLNHSFLGISFEAHTQDLYEGFYLTPSQIHSGHLLAGMLVNKYKIPLHNCITHAQVSVDPQNMTIGYHTDGSGNFPFQQMGLPNNYELPIPSLYLFGFDFDSRFLTLTGTRIWKGLLSADERLRREADSQHLSIGQHKEILRERYQKSMATLKTLGIIKDN
jgi:hypothetical protein